MKYLDGISSDEVEVIFLHSISCSFERPPRKRKGQKEEPPKLDNSESTHYNCTVKIPKYYAKHFFEDKAERCRVFSDFMAEDVLKQEREEQTAKKTPENTTMSASSERTEV